MVGKEEYIFHNGPPAKRSVPDEGTVRTKAVAGAAAAVMQLAE